ncbi:hypothetical protein HEK616_40790 [Streptomyces nigrescens]|uniref:Uncharacterized protein n=2 Tax=Streptomyces nigrescens TaxID=1920 RepID=A0ABN6QWN6_STRNI|nr:hypothetical protein HEK616_40790 [Streptomyces nigrescens]
MTYGELRRRLNEMPLSADRDPVMFRDNDTAQLLELTDVVYEGQSDDGEGNVTSVGGTVWISGELH